MFDKKRLIRNILTNRKVLNQNTERKTLSLMELGWS